MASETSEEVPPAEVVGATGSVTPEDCLLGHVDSVELLDVVDEGNLVVIGEGTSSA